jgi:glycosyltransferase involved in cell wall biosynthesis
VVGCVSQLRAQKAPLDFVAVAQRVTTAIPEARFVWIGDGPLRREVTRAAEGLGPADRLLLAGGRENVERLYPAFDVFLLTSLWEGLPRTVVEAFAVGIPVVATAVRGTSEAVEEGVTGLLAAPGDVAGLARQVLRLRDEPGLAERLTAAARGRAPEFSIDQSVAALARLYRDLLG